MDTGFFLKGLIIGFCIAAPVGPIGIMCIRRTLAEGGMAGFVSGLGAATADAVYGGIAALGLTAVSALLLGQTVLLQLVGGLFLTFLGARFFLKGWGVVGPESAVRRRVDHGYSAYFQTFVLTLTNPMTLLSFAAIFAGAGLGKAAGPQDGMLLVTGVFLGSATWWLILSGLANALRARLNIGRLAWVNRISGLGLALFGLTTLLGMAL
jgi:threonine/homoserine/homoserine lactone efflux protein